MQKRVFRQTALIVICAVLLSAIVAGSVLYRFFSAQLSDELRKQVTYITAVLDREPDNLTYLKEVEATFPDTRITWITQTGEVLYDSAVHKDKLENHLTRPEIQAALTSAYGESVRRSDSWQRLTRYAAMRLEEGTVVRVSKGQQSVMGMLFKLLVPFLLMMVPVLILIFLLTQKITARLVAPLNRLKLDAPLDNDVSYPELAPLLTRLDKQNKAIEAQLKELTNEKDKLETITENMREAMVLLDEDGCVISINASALALFQKSKHDAMHSHILNLNRLPSVQAATEKALLGTADEAMVDIHSKSYLLMASPVRHGGAVLVFLDVTEKQNAENMRREFSANVSHELKTPLTAISGYAEIMENGLAKPEDMQKFSGRIHQEAMRLLALINDIIRLSHLDEGVSTEEMQPVDLWEVVNDVSSRLSEKAAACGIELILSGDSGIVKGIAHVLQEIVFNLIDNAIRYNHEGGRVQCEVLTSGERVMLTVSDNGIGIPPEDREKVFERFYRVDKSHSKDTGGTGLGLSIVKHGVRLHDGLITLQSKEGKGTTIRIAFPRG